MSNDNVVPIAVYIQSRQTKLGLATVCITPVQDLWEATVTIEDGQCKFSAEGIFSTSREAEIWAYGCKQEQNDYYSGYKREGNILTETKPPKNRNAEVLTIAQALAEVQHNYDNFVLGASSKIKGEVVSIKELTTSTLLSAEDKTVMANLLVKLGKGGAK